MKKIAFAAAFVFDAQKRLLCVQERFDFDNNLHWVIPCGGIDEGETPEQAAARETMEEAGVQVSGTPQRFYEINIIRPDSILTAYGIYFPDHTGDMNPSAEEITGVEFFALDQARDHMRKIGRGLRIDPIFAALDAYEKTGTVAFFRWDYTLDENDQIVDKKVMAAA